MRLLCLFFIVVAATSAVCAPLGATITPTAAPRSALLLRQMSELASSSSSSSSAGPQQCSVLGEWVAANPLVAGYTNVHVWVTPDNFTMQISRPRVRGQGVVDPLSVERCTKYQSGTYLLSAPLSPRHVVFEEVGGLCHSVPSDCWCGADDEEDDDLVAGNLQWLTCNDLLASVSTLPCLELRLRRVPSQPAPTAAIHSVAWSAQSVAHAEATKDGSNPNPCLGDRACSTCALPTYEVQPAPPPGLPVPCAVNGQRNFPLALKLLNVLQPGEMLSFSLPVILPSGVSEGSGCDQVRVRATIFDVDPSTFCFRPTRQGALDMLVSQSCPVQPPYLGTEPDPESGAPIFTLDTADLVRGGNTTYYFALRNNGEQAYYAEVDREYQIQSRWPQI